MHYFSAGISTDNVTFLHPFVHAAASCHNEEEPFEPTSEIEAQTIRNLLPDEDDLLSDVFNDLEFCSDAKKGDNTENFDPFSSVGGMKLEEDNVLSAGNRGFDFVGGLSHSRGISKGLLTSTNKFAPSWTGGLNQCLMRKCRELEKDGAGLSRIPDGILSSQFDGLSTGSLKGIYSANQNVLGDGSYIPNSFPSSLDVSSAGDHFGLPIPSDSLNSVKFGGGYISSSKPHSFPNCENNLNYFLPIESGSNVANMTGSIASDMKNIRQTSRAGPNRQPLEFQGRVIGPLSNATYPIHGHPWSNCYLFHHNSLGHNVSPNPSLFSNVVHAPSPPQKTGFSAFCSGSLKNVGPFSSFPLHPIARGSPILSHSGLNCKIFSNDVINSSPQTAHSFGSPPEIWRNLSRRRNQGSNSHANKKEFELDIQSILRGEDGRTTLMLKNIPNKYSSKMLLAVIDEHCRGIYDFVYLPIDFKNNCNVGYAFINLIDPLQIVPFFKSFNGKKWEKFNSEKVSALAYARIQGKAALIDHFQNSSLMNEDKGCRPVLFCTDGPNAGKQEPFPLGTNIRVKSSKARGSAHAENCHYHGSPSTSPNSSESDRGSISPKSVIA